MGVCALAIFLALPVNAHAGLVEIIAEMSGPKMIGITADCRLALDGTWESCKASGPLAPLKIAGSALTEQRPPRVWISLAGGYYFSSDATVNQVHYNKGEVKMWVFDPMLEFESKSWPKDCRTLRAADCPELKYQIYHGALGMSYNVLFGEGFPTFSNVGFKMRPVGVVVPVVKRLNLPWSEKTAAIGFDFSYDVRVYTRRFTAEDFGKVAVEPEENGAETVHAFVFGARVKISK
jgi:hypothetical protein